ncbi:V-type proton ATPase subunit S1-like [Clavelina lepadiformis]|uniref:V-type proton ATPase subunit S1-like n=1 Tax=Clavelina lepadiformis TaxID=159417 RepID=UPI0040431E49
MLSKLSICFAVVLFIIKLTFASEFVPLFLWTNVRDSSCKYDTPLGPGETISSVLTETYLKCLASLEPDKAFIFVADRLGIEDFTVYANGAKDEENPLRNVKTFMQHDSSIAAPSVEPSNIIEDLHSKLKPIVKENINQMYFPKFDRSSHTATASGLMHLDRQIRDTLQASSGNFVAVLTSERNPDSYGTQNEKTLGGSRQLLEDKKTEKNDTRQMLVGDCLYMAFSSVQLIVGDKKETMANVSTPDFTMIDCKQISPLAKAPVGHVAGNITIQQTFKIQNSTSETVDVEMRFVQRMFQVSYRLWWYLDSVQVTHNGIKTPFDRDFKDSIYAPANWSFICYNGKMSNKANKSNPVSLTLEFLDWQVQPFILNRANNTFGPAYDCIGWFTGPIWSGLLATLLLVFFLAFGVSQLSSITTMDRFDDPKAKTITVPQDTS